MDEGLLVHLTELLACGQMEGVRASGRVSLESHPIGFAAEQARSEGRVVEMRPYREAVACEAAGR